MPRVEGSGGEERAIDQGEGCIGVCVCVWGGGGGGGGGGGRGEVYK